MNCKITDTKKWCNGCKDWKLHKEFNPCSDPRRSGFSVYCKDCTNKRNRTNYSSKERSPEYRATRKRWKQANALRIRVEQYGLTPEKYKEMWDAQGGKCYLPSCNNPASCIDHDHVTGQVRGLLCRTCNLALGHFRDSLQLLKEAVAYLEKFL